MGIANQFCIVESSIQSQSVKMFRRLVVIAVLCLAVVCANNYSWGHRFPNDRLLHRAFEKKESKFLQVVEGDFYFPNMTVSGINCRSEIID